MSKLRIAPRGALTQPDPPKAATLPDAARNQLGMLVTEVHGVGRLLYLDEVSSDSETAGAIGLWLERIPQDLGTLECYRAPAAPPADDVAAEATR